MPVITAALCSAGNFNQSGGGEEEVEEEEEGGEQRARTVGTTWAAEGEEEGWEVGGSATTWEAAATTWAATQTTQRSNTADLRCWPNCVSRYESYWYNICILQDDFILQEWSYVLSVD